jgi:hypothetical protein
VLDDYIEPMPDDDKLIRRERRIGLILVGILAVGGGAWFGLTEMATLAVVYAHWSNPTPEFKAAGDAKMMLALLLIVFGIACLASRRRKHWLVVAVLAIAVIINAAIAVGLENLSDRSVDAQRGTPIIVDPTTPPPTVPITQGQ